MTLEQQVAALLDQVREHENVIARMEQEVHTHEQQLRPARSAPLLNRLQADKLYSAPTMRKQLGAGGVAPLDLSGLKGAAADIQPAAVPEVPELPQLGDPSVKQGTILKAAGIIYRRGANDWEPIVSPASKSGGGISQPAGTAIDLQPVPGPGSGAWVQSGSFELRPVTSTVGTLYIETSRSTIAASAPMPIYQYQAGGWAYIAGMFYRTQAQLAALAATLVATDAGVVVYVTSPYCHRLLWSGAAWGWADPADASGRFAFWQSAPGDGWHASDGSTVARLKSDGTTQNVLLPDSVGISFFLKTGAYTGAAQPAVDPTAAAVSAGTPSGTISGATFAGTPATLTGSVGTIAQTLTVGTTIANGTGVAATMAAQSHTHPAPTLAMNPYTPAGTVTGTAFAGAALGTHTHAISLAGGDPVPFLACPLYYRL